ncbi:MAG: type II 3-dehydroquinate dehydratase [Proteobacteria bacterium]|jgi:3-dehydroquinate dehydratase-2|nr:type II 3-dehydroquinate dehydratase [Pseudomonadota bacterium]
MRKVLVLNGPNLNLLGTREPAIYGRATLADAERVCADEARRHGAGVDCRQSNHEGQLVDWIHEAGREHAAGTLVGVVLNAGAYTHTSIALRDAIAAAGVPVVELHLSNTHAREPFRHHSYLAAVALGVIQGFGITGYALAVDALLRTHGGGGIAQGGVTQVSA